MEFYKGVVRLRSGDETSVFTGEVPKDRLSVPEILILRKLHGPDAIVVGEKCGDEKIKHGEERRRLAHTYGPKVVNQLFGEDWQQLPVKLPKLNGPSLEDMAA